MDRLPINIVFLIFISVSILNAEQTDSTNVDSLSSKEITTYQNNSIIMDWRIFNYPFVTPNGGELFLNQIRTANPSATNHSNLITSREEMLAQFRLQQNWDVKKKYGAFAKYLGYAQLLGAAGLLGVHIYQWSNLKDMPSGQPQSQPFNKYDFK